MALFQTKKPKKIGLDFRNGGSQVFEKMESIVLLHFVVLPVM